MDEELKKYQMELLNEAAEILGRADQVEEKDLRDYWKHDLTKARSLLNDLIEINKAPNDEAKRKIMNHRR